MSVPAHKGIVVSSPVGRPWVWLAAGWSDIARAPAVSIGYGLVIVALSFLVTLGAWLAGVLYLVLPLAAGFFLLAPVLAVGLYDVSRRHEAGLPVGFAGAFTAWRRNGGQIALMGLVLTFFFLAWLRIATLIFALFFGVQSPSFDRFVVEVFLSWQSLPFLIVGTVTGAVLAAIAFALSVVSLPMLLDRDTDVFHAAAASVAVARANPAAMAVWAGLIVLFTAAGLVTGFVGLAITLPLIAHASWHAYRDLCYVADDEEDGELAYGIGAN